MSEGFFEQRRASPTGFATVVLLHAAVLGAVVMIKGPPIVPYDFGRTRIEFIEPPLPDQPPPPPPQTTERPPIPTRATTIVDLSNITPTLPNWPIEPPGNPRIGDGTIVSPPDPPAHVPVRRGAEVDPRYAAALQPPYPTSEQRAGREGTVQMRVTIGVDGRVRAVERISATSDDFWRAAERQALTRWRFRPATLDGQPVESTKIMSLRFVLEGQA